MSQRQWHSAPCVALAAAGITVAVVGFLTNAPSGLYAGMGMVLLMLGLALLVVVHYLSSGRP